MAELQVGIKANVGETKKIVRSIKEIRRAANDASATLQKTSLSATSATVSLQGTATTSLNLAKSQNLASVANVAVARTLDKVAVSATRTTLAETGTTKQTNILSAALARMGNIGSAAFFKVGASAKRMGTQVRTAGASIAGLGIAGAGLGALLAVGLGVGIKSAVEFELTMSRIIGLVGIAESEVEAFKKPLLAIGKATAKGPVELAEALFFITSAGAKGADALEILEASAKAASAGLGETKAVADAVTSAMNAYGKENLSAAESTDILVSAVREGKAAADEIAGAIGQVLPIASQLGVTFDQVGATIAALTRVGLNAALSATALKATLNSLSKPGNEAVETLSRLSQQNLGVKLSFDDIRKVLREDGLIAALNLLQEATGGNTQELQKIFPNIRAGVGVFSLLGKNAKQVAEIFERMKDSTGATDLAFEAFTNTTAFTLKEALVALQVSLQKIGEDLLPAVAKAFVFLASAVSGTVDLFEKLGESVARALIGSDDPYIRAKERQEELNDAVRDFSVTIASIRKFDPVSGKVIVTEIRRPLTELDKWLVKTLGINKAGVELTGTYEEQLAQLTKAADAANVIVRQMDSEIRVQEEINRKLEEGKDTLEETADIVDDIKPAKVIDNESLTKGKKSLKDLTDEIALLTTDLGNIANLGQAGLGLASNAAHATEIFDQLQGEVKLTKDEIIRLIEQKEALAIAIDQVNQGFDRQRDATRFIADLIMGSKELAGQFALVSGGGSLIDVQAAQEAVRLMRDLGDETTHTKESLTQLIILQHAQNAALAALDPTGVKDLLTFVQALRLEQESFNPEDSQFVILDAQIKALQGSIIDTALAAEGLKGLDTLVLDALPKEEQFAAAALRLKDAFNLKGIVDPEENPEFITALDALRARIFSVGDATKEFAIQAARNLQTAFADFLFDPFAEGLEGMARGFAETIQRMAAEALSKQILTSLFGAFGGGSLVSGFADGGRVHGNETVLVGERGPELFTPGQSGNIVSNEMMRGQMQAAPIVNVAPTPVVVLDDPRKVIAAMQSTEGKRAMVDSIGQKRGAVNQALNAG